MDKASFGVALAAVITTGVVGLVGSGLTIWKTFYDAKLARENRTYQRHADSYLEVLRLVEREGQWVQAIIANREIAAKEAKSGYRMPWAERVELPEPAVTDRAVIAAHLEVVGSDNVRRLYSAWRGEIDDIEAETAVMKAYPEDGVPSRPGLAAGNELRARQALADAIAEELGQRRKKGNYSWRYGESKF